MKKNIPNITESQEETFFTDLAFKHRLQLARMYAEYDDPREFAKAAGISSSTYYQYESGRSKSVKNQKTLTKLGKATGVSPEWLSTGKGYPIPNKPESYEVFEALAKQSQIKPYEELDPELLQAILQQLLANKQNLSAETMSTIAVKTYQRLSSMRLDKMALLKVVATTLGLVLELYKA